ncbi:MAG: hypothetical protein ACRCXZ_00425 [Patescibacteria group bacterium]
MIIGSKKGLISKIDWWLLINISVITRMVYMSFFAISNAWNASALTVFFQIFMGLLNLCTFNLNVYSFTHKSLSECAFTQNLFLIFLMRLCFGAICLLNIITIKIHFDSLSVDPTPYCLIPLSLFVADMFVSLLRDIKVTQFKSRFYI